MNFRSELQKCFQLLHLNASVHASTFWSPRSILVLLNIFRAQYSQTWLYHSHYLSANVRMSAPCKHLWHTCLNATGELTKHSWVFPIKVYHSSTRLHWPVSHAPTCTHGASWKDFFPFIYFHFFKFIFLLSIYLLHITDAYKNIKGYKIKIWMIYQSISGSFLPVYVS